MASSDWVTRKRIRTRSLRQSSLGVKLCARGASGSRGSGAPTKVTLSRTSGSRFRRWDQAKAATVARTRRAKTSAAAEPLPRGRGIVLADDHRDVGPGGDGFDFPAHQFQVGDAELLGDLACFRLVAAFEHDDAVFVAGAAVGDGAEQEALALDFVAVDGGEAGSGGAVEHRHLDLARLHLRRGLLAAFAVGTVVGAVDHRVGDPADDRHGDDEGGDQPERVGEALAEPREAFAHALAPGYFRQAFVAALAPFLALADRLVLGGARLLQLAQLLGPLRGHGRGRLLALGVALGGRARPLAQAAEVPSLGEREQGENREPDERRQAGEGADLFDDL